MNVLIHAERTCLLASRFLAAMFTCFFIHGSAWGAGPVGSGEAQSEELLEAARAGDMAAVQRMLDRDRGVSLEVRDPMGLTAAQVARLRGQEEVLALLAAHGAIVDEPLPAAEELVERLLRGRIREDGPGVAVLVGRHGNVVLKQASGLAQIEDGNAVRPDTRFPIESITKPFTAAAILKLQEEGKMYVGDKLAEYLPDFPRADEVTIHQLLTHTSGIQSYTAKYYSRESVMAPISSEALIESFRDDPYNFDPGTQMRYNNSGYFLLGHLIERISGQPYGDFLRERLFEPLGMHNTGLDDGSGRLGIVKDGYFFRDGKFALTEEWHPSWGVAAGSLYSTVEDLFLWKSRGSGNRIYPGRRRAGAPGRAPSGRADFVGREVALNQGGPLLIPGVFRIDVGLV